MRVKEGWGVGSWSDSMWEVMKDAVLKCSAWGFLSPFPLLHRHTPGEEARSHWSHLCHLSSKCWHLSHCSCALIGHFPKSQSELLMSLGLWVHKAASTCRNLFSFTVHSEKGGRKGYQVNKWQSRLSWLWTSVWVTHSPEMSPRSYLSGPASPFPPLAFPAGALSKHQGTSLEIIISACWVTWSSGL